MARSHPNPRLFLLVALGALAACSKAAPEPEGRPASSAAPTPAVAPLVWDAPGSWTKLNDPPSGPRKAAYRIDKVGNDKEEAEMTVFFYGTGSKGDPETSFKEWIGQFDVGAATKREEIPMKAPGWKAEAIDLLGNYKIALTPPAKGKKQPPVAMVKNGWRLYGAVVKTPDRGNWFFKMVGPDDTVQSAKSAFRAMLDSMR